MVTERLVSAILASRADPSYRLLTNHTQEAADDSSKTATADPPPTKSKPNASDEPSSDGGVGIADIKKAVAFSNSVGGLEKATALLQILKLARDVQ